MTRWSLSVPALRAAAAWVVALTVLTPVAPARAAAAEVSRAEAELAFAQGLAAFERGDLATAGERFAAAAAADPADRTLAAWAERARAGGGAGPEPYTTKPYGGVPRWEASVGLAAGDDSNAALLAPGQRALSRDDPTTVRWVGEPSDNFAEGGLRLAVTPFSGGAGGWTFGLAGEGRRRIYGDLDGLDRGALRGAAHLAWGGDPLGYLEGPLGYARVPYGNRPVALLLSGAAATAQLDGERVATLVEGAAALTLRESSRTATRLTAAFRDSDYADDFGGVFDRGGSELTGGVGQRVYFGRRDRFLGLGGLVGSRDAGARYDGSTTGVEGEAALPFGDRWTLHLTGGWQRVDYDEPESNPLFPFFLADGAREDTLRRLDAELSWRVLPRLLVVGHAGRSERQADFGGGGSTLLDLDYERTELAVGLRWVGLAGGAR